MYSLVQWRSGRQWNASSNYSMRGPVCILLKNKYIGPPFRPVHKYDPPPSSTLSTNQCISKFPANSDRRDHRNLLSWARDWPGKGDCFAWKLCMTHFIDELYHPHPYHPHPHGIPIRCKTGCTSHPILTPMAESTRQLPPIPPRKNGPHPVVSSPIQTGAVTGRRGVSPPQSPRADLTILTTSPAHPQASVRPEPPCP